MGCSLFCLWSKQYPFRDLKPTNCMDKEIDSESDNTRNIPRFLSTTTSEV